MGAAMRALESQIVLITGAAGGLGAEITKAFWKWAHGWLDRPANHRCGHTGVRKGDPAYDDRFFTPAGRLYLLPVARTRPASLATFTDPHHYSARCPRRLQPYVGGPRPAKAFRGRSCQRNHRDCGSENRQSTAHHGRRKTGGGAVCSRIQPALCHPRPERVHL